MLVRNESGAIDCRRRPRTPGRIDPSYPSGSALREPMIEDMGVRGFTENTRRDYIRSGTCGGLSFEHCC